MGLRSGWDKLKEVLGVGLSLGKASFKVRNEGSYLGIIWYLLNPLAMFLIILFIGGAITNTNIANYPVYLLLGLIMFNFFRQSTINSTNAIIGNAGFIKSIKVNYESFIISGLVEGVFSHFFEIVILILFILYFKVPIIWLLFYPVVLFFLILFILGFSFILATLGTYIYDLGNIWAVLVNLLWFATPIFYILPKESLTLVNKLNPMYYFVNVARDLVLYQTVPETKMIFITVLIGVLSLIFGLLIFERFKNKFAELV